MPSDDPLKRVADILRSIALITGYISRAGGVEVLLRTEDEFHDGVERRLLIISEAAVKLGDIVERLEPDIPWRDIRAIGNVLRHDYDHLDADVLKEILLSELEPLARACERLKITLTSH